VKEYASSENWNGNWHPASSSHVSLKVIPTNKVSTLSNGQEQSVQAKTLAEDVGEIFGWMPDSEYIIFTNGTIDANGNMLDRELKMLRLDTLETINIDCGRIYDSHW